MHESPLPIESTLKEDAVEMGIEPHEVSRRGEIVREGKYVAEVDAELLENETGWSPYLSLDDAYKLDDVREALRRGDITAASRSSRTFPSTPVS